MDMDTKVATAPCPGCGLTVKLGVRPREGHRLNCPQCGDYLEIINLGPPELDWAYDDFEPDEEYWDEDEGDGEGNSIDSDGSDYWEP